MITINDLKFTYHGRAQASITGINLTIKKGEFVLLTGPTGCGKSTLLKTLNGLIPHECAGGLEGQVMICGLDTRKAPMSELTRRVGMVFQSPEDQLFSTLVEDEVAFGPENLCLPAVDIELRIEQALKMAGMSDFRYRPVSTLSGGEKQRVAIASILAMQPHILALDEPLSQLDPDGAKDILNVLRELNRGGMTIVLIEHRLPEVIPLADRVIVMDKGKIILDRSRDEAVKQTAIFEDLGLIPPLSQKITLADLQRNKRAVGFSGHNGHGEDDMAIGAENLWFRYSGKNDYSLKGVSLKIRRGEMVAIVGSNGAGKSTLLLNLGAVLTPEKGKVMIEGNGTHKLTPYRLAGKLGIMFQNPDLLLFSPTVWQEVEFGPRALSFPPELMNRIVCGLLMALNIAHLEEDPPQALSKGQRLRVAAASILSLRPGVVLLDEPTCGQDRVHIQGLMSYLKDLTMTGVSTVFITHHLETAAEYADRILVMDEGRISSEM